MRTALVLLMMTGFVAADDKPKTPGYEVDKDGFLIPPKRGGLNNLPKKNGTEKSPGPSLGPTLDPIVVKLRAKSTVSRVKGCRELADLGEEASPAAKYLCKALLDPNTDVAKAALVALEKVAPDLYSPISMVMLDADHEKRLAGFKLLGLMLEKADPAAEFILFKLRQAIAGRAGSKDYSIEYRLYSDIVGVAFTALRSIRPDDLETVKLMKSLAGTGNQDAVVRHEAILFMMGWAGDDAGRRKDVAPLIRAGLANPYCMNICISAAGEYGAACKDCLIALRKLKLSSDAAVRQLATEAVARIEGGD